MSLAAVQESMPWVIRPWRASDTAFICDSWARTAFKEFHRRHPKRHPQSFYGPAREQIAAYLAAPETTVLVATDPEADWHIAGWLAYQDDTVLYVFVKSVFHGYGCARDLWRAAGSPAHYLSKSATATKLAAKVGATPKESE